MLDFVSILKARKNIRDIAIRTPLVKSRHLTELAGAEVYLKLENLQRTGSFKIRGAINVIRNLNDEQKKRGVITSSAGNHAQGVALGAKLFGIDAKIVMPENTPGVKVENTKCYGAQVVLYGRNYDEAHEHCQKLAERERRVYIPAFEDYDVMSGQGTIALEILEEIPDLDMILVPVGGGGLISGIAVAAKTVNPGIKVIGVQSTAAYTMYECFKAGRMVDVPVPPTIAEGLSGGIDQVTFDIVKKYVDEMVLAEEEGLLYAIAWLATHERQIAEGSGIVGVAALLQKKVQLPERGKAAVVISGGNIDGELLRKAFRQFEEGKEKGV